MENPLLTAFHGEGESLVDEYVLTLAGAEVKAVEFNEKDRLPKGALGFLVRITVVNDIVAVTRQRSASALEVLAAGQLYQANERDVFAFTRGSAIRGPLLYLASATGAGSVRVMISAIRVGYPTLEQVA